MTGKREQVLARMAAVIEAVPGIEQFKRNDPQYDEEKLPCAIMLDGDEDVVPGTTRRGPGFTISQVDAQPEVYLMVQTDAENAGPNLNQMQRRIINAVMHDTQLLALVHNEKVEYLGALTALAMGRSLSAEMLMKFSLHYIAKTAPPTTESTE